FEAPIGGKRDRNIGRSQAFLRLAWRRRRRICRRPLMTGLGGVTAMEHTRFLPGATGDSQYRAKHSSRPTPRTTLVRQAASCDRHANQASQSVRTIHISHWLNVAPCWLVQLPSVIVRRVLLNLLAR